MQILGEEIQEGPSRSSESTQVREVRGHVQLDLFERCVRLAQSQVQIPSKVDLCKSSFLRGNEFDKICDLKFCRKYDFSIEKASYR